MLAFSVLLHVRRHLYYLTARPLVQRASHPANGVMRLKSMVRVMAWVGASVWWFVHSS